MIQEGESVEVAIEEVRTKAVKSWKEDGVGFVEIDHPPLNVMSSYIFSQVGEAFAAFEHDNEVVAVILTTSGDRAFAAGADIKEFPVLMNNPQMHAFVMNTHEVLHRIESFPKPTIVVLDGLTLGGGCELALTFDIRIAEEHALIGLPEVKLGLFPGGGGTQRLPRIVGSAKAKEMMYTGEPITAMEAERLGLINHVVPKGEGREKAREVASKIVRHSLQSLSRIKEAVNDGLQKSLRDGIDLEARLFEEVFQTEDVQTGVSAFLERRQPTFHHR